MSIFFSFIPSRPFLHTQDMYFVFVQLLSSGSAWFAIIIIVITCLFPDVVKKVFYRHLQPTNTQKSQVMHKARQEVKLFVFCLKSISLISLPELKTRVNQLCICYLLISCPDFSWRTWFHRSCTFCLALHSTLALGIFLRSWLRADSANAKLAFFKASHDSVMAKNADANVNKS